jgi:hypothetical protein
MPSYLHYIEQRPCGAADTCICDLMGSRTCQPKHPKKLYSTKQTPRGSVVVLGDHIISEHEMSDAEAQQQADWLNHRKSA